VKTISRRSVLKTTAGSLFASSSYEVFGQAPRTTPAFAGMPLGIHGATLQKFPLTQILRMLQQDLQLHYLELTPSQVRLRAVAQGANQGPAATLSAVRAVREQLAMANVTPTAWGPIALSRQDSDLPQLFELASELGVRNLTCITQAEHLDVLENLANQHALRIAIHNNAPGSSFSKIADVLQALNGRGPNVGACLDVGNAIRASEDPTEALRSLGKHVIGIHLKSVDSRQADSEVVELGTGLFDAKHFLVALQQTELVPDIALSLEYLAQPEQPLPGILRSLTLVQAALSA
jgi:inosose dehydratase